MPNAVDHALAADAASMGDAVYDAAAPTTSVASPAPPSHGEPVPVTPAADAASMGSAVYPQGDADASLAVVAPLLRELNDLKRVRAAHFTGSYADRLFVDAWRQLLAGVDASAVAMNITARAIVATRLAGIDAESLRTHGLNDGEITELFVAAVDNVGDAVPRVLRGPLRAALASAAPAGDGDVPDFVARQLRQPRAGATHPGKPRRILEPAESHGDHCLMVAVYAVLVTPRFGGDPGRAFLTGLAHHLFNATLPDAGFNGDVVMQSAGVLDRVVKAAFDHAFAEMKDRAPDLVGRVRTALAFTKRTDAPESRCFHAADVFDRVLEMDWFARSAAFTLADAVVGLDIVHVAPEQAFQRDALAESGIWKDWPRE